MNIFPVFNELHKCWFAEFNGEEYRSIDFQSKQDCQNWIDTAKALIEGITKR